MTSLIHLSPSPEEKVAVPVAEIPSPRREYRPTSSHVSLSEGLLRETQQKSQCYQHCEHTETISEGSPLHHIYHSQPLFRRSPVGAGYYTAQSKLEDLSFGCAMNCPPYNTRAGECLLIHWRAGVENLTNCSHPTLLTTLWWQCGLRCWRRWRCSPYDAENWFSGD